MIDQKLDNPAQSLQLKEEAALKIISSGKALVKIVNFSLSDKKDFDFIVNSIADSDDQPSHSRYSEQTKLPEQSVVASRIHPEYIEELYNDENIGLLWDVGECNSDYHLPDCAATGAANKASSLESLHGEVKLKEASCQNNPTTLEAPAKVNEIMVDLPLNQPLKALFMPRVEEVAISSSPVSFMAISKRNKEATKYVNAICAMADIKDKLGLTENIPILIYETDKKFTVYSSEQQKKDCETFFLYKIKQYQVVKGLNKSSASSEKGEIIKLWLYFDVLGFWDEKDTEYEAMKTAYEKIFSENKNETETENETEKLFVQNIFELKNKVRLISKMPNASKNIIYTIIDRLIKLGVENNFNKLEKINEYLGSFIKAIENPIEPTIKSFETVTKNVFGSDNGTGRKILGITLMICGVLAGLATLAISFTATATTLGVSAPVSGYAAAAVLAGCAGLFRAGRRIYQSGKDKQKLYDNEPILHPKSYLKNLI